MIPYMRALLFCLALFFTAAPSGVYAQKAKMSWLKSTYSSSIYTGVRMQKTAVDKQGNVYHAGSLQTGYDTVFFDKDNYYITESMDAYVVKYTANGSVAWSQIFANIETTGMYHQDLANSVAVDEQGNCYITGHHSSPIKIGKDSLEGNTGFLVKLDSSGTIKWARNIGGTLTNICKTDKSGNVIVAGGYDNFSYAIHKVDTTTMYTYGERDIYVAKFSATGKLIWHVTVGGQSDDYFSGITIDDNENIYMSCYLSHNPFINKVAFTGASGSIAMIKINRNGKVVNKKYFSSFNGAANLQYSSYENCLYILFGWYGYNLTLSSTKTISAKGMDLALAKFDTAFNYKEAIHFTDDKSMSGSLILDKDYNPIVFGLGNEAVILANGDTIANRSKQDRRIFISKFAKDLSFMWAEEIENDYYANTFDVASHPQSTHFVISGNYYGGMKYYQDSLYTDAGHVFTAAMITKDNKGFILGSKYLCQGALGNYYVKADKGSKYEWTIKGGKIITSKTDTNDILLRWHTGDAPYLALKQTYANNTVMYDTIRPQVIGIDVSKIIGDTIICPGSTKKYAAKFLNDNTYTWDLSAGNFTTISQDSIRITWKDTGVHFVKLAIRSNITGCEDTVQLKVYVGNPKAKINGSASVCIGKNAVLTTNQLAHEKVLWKASNGNISGSNTNDTLQISWATSGKKSITLIKSSSAGCADSAVFEVNVEADPAVSISGEQLICKGKTARYIAHTGAQNLQWSISGGKLLSGQGNDTVFIAWDDTLPAEVKVVTTTAGNCTDSAIVPVKVMDVPQLDFHVANVCFGDSVHIYNSSKIPSAHTYTWRMGDGAVSHTMQPTHLYSQPGKYKITLRVDGSCADSLVKEVTVFPPAAKPTITLRGDTLLASTATTYQWYKDKTLIKGATAKAFVPGASGQYEVEITDANGCKNVSAAFKFTALDTLQGFVTQSNTMALKNTRIYLLKIDYKDTVLQTADSTFTDSLGFYRFLLRDSIVYLTAAPDMAIYPREMPTYFDSAVVFTFAKPIPVHRGRNVASWQTRSGINSGGTGFISGKIVTCTACKKADEGEPVTGIKVFLADEENNPLAFTFTNWEGNFSFANLPVGKYKVWVDKFPVDNSKAPEVAITAEQQQQINLRFTLYPTLLVMEENIGFKETDKSAYSINVFPNPFSSQTDVVLLLQQSQQVSIVLTDLSGKRLMVLDKASLPAGSHNISIQKEKHKLVAGIYLLQVQTQSGIKTQKLVVQ